MVVYDKAKWHFGGDFPADLPIKQGYVHTGMFLTWVIRNDLYSDEFAREEEDSIRLVKTRLELATNLYKDAFDGVFDSDMLNEAGNKFAAAYYEGKFVKDYEAAVAVDLPSTYHVPDTWDTYDRLEPIIDARFQEWRQSRS